MSNILTKVYFIIFILFISSIGYGQKKICIGFVYTDKTGELSGENQVYAVVDSVNLANTVNEKINDFLVSGYPAVNLDTIIMKKDTCLAYIFRGQKYTIGKIKFSQEQLAILEESGIKRYKLTGKPLDTSYLKNFLKILIKYQSNTGYPFATAKFDSVVFEGKQLYANLKIDKGRFIEFDSTKMEGRIQLSSGFIMRFLDIKPGQYYSHEKILRAGPRLNDLQFARQASDPVVRFINNKASLVLTLDPKPASRFDFLIGLLPQVVNGVRKWNITGDFNAELNNNFGQGEYIFCQFKRLKPENLELQIKATLPYIAGLPVGSHVDFRIFKNADFNIDLFFNGGFQYLFGGYNNIKLYGSYRSSRLLVIDTDQIKLSSKLPERLDVTYSGVGMGLSLRKLDYRFNPSKGYAAEINTIIGRKKILANVAIQELEGFANSYDSLKQATVQVDFDANLAYYIPVKNWATFKLGGNLGLRYNQKGILQNELLRVGGIKTIRGFDEEGIFTDFYAYNTVEFRILFDQNSYMSLPFIDYGITHVKSGGKMVFDNVLGVGMGLNFGTPAGIFNLAFAAGKNLNNPIDFSKMKIHFGYVNLF